MARLSEVWLVQSPPLFLPASYPFVHHRLLRLLLFRSCYCTSFCPLKNLLDWSFLVGLLPLFSLLPALRCFSHRSSSVCLSNPSSFCWWRKDEAHLQGPFIFAFLPPCDISLTLNLSCLQDLKQQKFTIDAEPSETVSFDVPL